MREITLTEISELLGVTEETLRINYKRYSDKINDLGITKEGRGKKATYFKNENNNVYDKFKIAYDTYICIFRDSFNFDTRTNFDDLLLFLSYTKSHTSAKNHYFTIRDFSYITKIHENTLTSYTSKLKELKILKPKHCARKYYIALQRVYDPKGNPGIFTTDITELMQVEGLEEAWNGVNIPKKQKSDYWMKEIHIQILKDLEKYSIYNIYKLEFTPTFLVDNILNEIIYNAYCYKLMTDGKFLNLSLKLEEIQQYIQEIRSF